MVGRLRLDFLAVLACAFALELQAGLFTFVTANGSTVTDGAISAHADVTTGPGFMNIILYDDLANPKSAGQLVSAFDFNLLGISGNTALGSSSAQFVEIASHLATTGVTGNTGWGFGKLSTGFTVCGICDPAAVLSTANTVPPSQEIIGPGPYTLANSSIDGNGPHNPFLNQSATFVILNSSITSNTVVTNGVFSFGSTPGENNVSGIVEEELSGVPEPGTWLVGIGGFLLMMASRLRTSGSDRSGKC